MTCRVDVVFDSDETSPTHIATIAAVTHAADALGVHVEVDVVRTPAIDDEYFAAPPDGVVIGPGTPYEAPAGAERLVRSARESGLPLVGT